MVQKVQGWSRRVLEGLGGSRRVLEGLGGSERVQEGPTGSRSVLMSGRVRVGSGGSPRVGRVRDDPGGSRIFRERP